MEDWTWLFTNWRDQMDRDGKMSSNETFNYMHDDLSDDAKYSMPWKDPSRKSMFVCRMWEMRWILISLKSVLTGVKIKLQQRSVGDWPMLQQCILPNKNTELQLTFKARCFLQLLHCLATQNKLSRNILAQKTCFHHVASDPAGNNLMWNSNPK